MRHTHVMPDDIITISITIFDIFISHYCSCDAFAMLHTGIDDMIFMTLKEDIEEPLRFTALLVLLSFRLFTFLM